MTVRIGLPITLLGNAGLSVFLFGIKMMPHIQNFTVGMNEVEITLQPSALSLDPRPVLTEQDTALASEKIKRGISYFKDLSIHWGN